VKEDSARRSSDFRDGTALPRLARPLDLPPFGDYLMPKSDGQRLF